MRALPEEEAVSVWFCATVLSCEAANKLAAAPPDCAMNFLRFIGMSALCPISILKTIGPAAIPQIAMACFKCSLRYAAETL